MKGEIRFIKMMYEAKSLEEVDELNTITGN